MSFPDPTRRHWLAIAAAVGLVLASTAHAETAGDRAVSAVEINAAEAAPASTALAPAPAQAPLPKSPAAQPHAPLPVRHIEIGKASQALWALQREAVSVHPRHIDGAQASRSYQRYLKSFETQIPEQFSAGPALQK